MEFANYRQVAEAAMDWRESARAVKSELALVQGTAMCMYEGIQWLDSTRDRHDRTTAGSKLVNYTADSTKLRVVNNVISRLIQKVAAATYPATIEVEVTPLSDDPSVGALDKARVLEKAVNAAVDCSRLVHAAANANHRRCITGTWGIGISLRAQKRNLEGEEVPDCAVRAFDFSPIQLTLDPACNALNLIDHEYVQFTDAMTADAIYREYGLKLDPNQLKTIGELTPIEQGLNTLSDNRLFQRYRRHSRTKGALVHQIHVKDETGRFGQMWIMVETPDKDGFTPINEDDPMSPYGGCGMPFTLLHGHRRAESMWSLGDATLLRDGQQQRNIIATSLFRQIVRNSGYQILADKSAMGDVEDSEVQLHNTVGGIVWYKSGDRNRPGNAPAIMQYPAPQPMLQDLLNESERDMQMQVHRSEANFGQTKSHVDSKSFQKAIEEADQVLGQRINEDLDRYGSVCEVLAGTYVKQAIAGAPTVLADLKMAGFDSEDFASLAQTDPVRLGANIRVREASVRYRSHETRRNDLTELLQLQAVSPKKVRSELAGMLDRPVIADDRLYADEAQKAAASLLRGIPWHPKPLGEYGEDFIDAFRRALFDPTAKNNPSIAMLVNKAIVDQQAVMAQELAMMQPQQGTGGGEPAPTQQSGDAQAALDGIISAFTGGGSASSGQPAPVAA